MYLPVTKSVAFVRSTVTMSSSFVIPAKEVSIEAINSLATGLAVEDLISVAIERTFPSAPLIVTVKVVVASFSVASNL
ncbi:hypothetical protein SDC9_211964 [bioreactor metagenome]|uniref:Uncharacterized protein n=1 Tax=bioreactor metagenome TaxID=1076179 RepID=A0A645JYP0_9ZZZZ